MNAQASGSGSGSRRGSNAHSYDFAPALQLPSTTFYSVEYPSLLTSPTSIDTAVHTLGGKEALDAAFRRNSTVRPIELSFRPDDPFVHPVQGEVVDARGIVVKVTKRRKRKRREVALGEDGMPVEPQEERTDAPEEGGVYTTEAVGVLRKVARFRAMADFSFAPQEPNRILDLRKAMTNLDAKQILNFEFEPEKEDYIIYPDGTPVVGDLAEAGPSGAHSSQTPISNLRLIPPPRFSKTSVPHRYEFKQNVAAVPVTYVDSSTGEEKTRYQNKFRHKVTAITTISFDDPDEYFLFLLLGEADGMFAEPEGVDALDLPAQEVIERIRELFRERPIWSRLAMRNQLTEVEDHILSNARGLFQYTGYVFSDGPWRDFHIRWGYDPRKTTGARFYQRMQFRNFQNDYSRRPALRLLKSNDPNAEDVEELNDWRGIGAGRNRTSHIFDGKILHRLVGNYQLCDMTDPLLQRFIHDETAVSKECHPTDGWYLPVPWERIRAVARRKFSGLLEGRVVSDEECADLMEDELPQVVIREELRRLAEHRRDQDMQDRGKIARPRGHNMALQPVAREEEAAERLKRRLEVERGIAVGTSLGSDEM